MWSAYGPVSMHRSVQKLEFCRIISSLRPTSLCRDILGRAIDLCSPSAVVHFSNSVSPRLSPTPVFRVSLQPHKLPTPQRDNQGSVFISLKWPAADSLWTDQCTLMEQSLADKGDRGELIDSKVGGVHSTVKDLRPSQIWLYCVTLYLGWWLCGKILTSVRIDAHSWNKI